MSVRIIPLPISGGIDPSSATATPSDVRSSKTFFAGDETLKTGTIENYDGAIVSGGIPVKGIPYEGQVPNNWTRDISPIIKLLTSVPADIFPSNVTSMNYMFQYCSSLTTVPLFNTSNVTNMNYMFQCCSSLKSILMYGMKTSFDISSSTKFEESDLVVILNNLATVTTTQTLSMGATNLAKLTAEEIKIATDKAWTLA